MRNDHDTTHTPTTALLERAEADESFDRAMNPLMQAKPGTEERCPTAESAHPLIQQRSVLLVDADHHSREAIAGSLMDLELPFLRTDSIDWIDDPQTFALVILGPGSFDGCATLVSRIRRIDASVCLPIAVVGPKSLSIGMNQALSAGADDYIAWPMNVALIRARVEGLLAARLRNELALVQAMDRAENLERALHSNRSIGIALGILMATQKITSEEAFLLLKQLSQRSNRKLREVAEDVIYTGVLPEIV